jgi:hypothetical protein
VPDLVRLYIRQCVIGFAIAAAFVAALIGFDVAHLRHLVLASDIGLLAVALLVLFNGIVFAGVQFALAVMGMQDRPEPPEGGMRDPSDAVPVPVPVPARRRR